VGSYVGKVGVLILVIQLVRSISLTRLRRFIYSPFEKVMVFFFVTLLVPLQTELLSEKYLAFNFFFDCTCADI